MPHVADTPLTERAVRERQTDAWFRPLEDGRIEVMCKTPGYRIRISAPEEKAWEAVELFEEWTGLSVQSERRPKRRVRPSPGQLSMVQLDSDGNAHAGEPVPAEGAMEDG